MTSDLIPGRPAVQPYRALYDLLISRSELRGAAGAMLAYARRLRAEAPAGGEAEALTAYEAAMNALSVLDEEEAWLDLGEPFLAAHCSREGGVLSVNNLPQPGGSVPGGAGGRRGRLGAGSVFAGRAMAEEEEEEEDRMEEEEEEGLVNLSDLDDDGGMLKEVMTVQGLQKEYLVFRCAVTVAERMPGFDPMQQWGGEEEVFNHLLHGSYLSGQPWEAALALAHACWSGGALTTALERALGALASECARAQLASLAAPGGGGGGADTVADQHSLRALMGGLPPPHAHPSSSAPHPPASSSLQHLSSVDDEDLKGVGSMLGSGATAPRWALLRALTRRLDLARGGTGGGGGASLLHGGRLRLAVADSLLKVDRRLALPPWLLRLFHKNEEEVGGGRYEPSAAASLLVIYLNHDRLADAVALSVSLLNSWGEEEADPRRRTAHSAVVWLPHQTIGKVRARLLTAASSADSSSSSSASAASGQLLLELDAAIARHFELVAHDSGVPHVVASGGVEAAAGGGFGGFEGGAGVPFAGFGDDILAGHSSGFASPLPPPSSSLLWA